MKNSDKSLKNFIHEEDGTATILAIFFCFIVLVMGGMAVDFQKRQADSQHLQNAADSAAHAALLARQSVSESEAKVKGLAVLDKMLPRRNMRASIGSVDFTFGAWDYDNRSFTSSPGSTKAVRVYSGMTEARGNATPNLLLSMIGFDNFNVAAESIHAMKRKPCSFQGLLAEEVLTIDSNNTYGPGFCLHSNDYVTLMTGNFFTADDYDAKVHGSKVSMPFIEDMVIPNSGLTSNTNLEGAKAEGWYDLSPLHDLPNIIDNLAKGVGPLVPASVQDTGQLTLTELQPTDVAPGFAYTHSCPGGMVTFKSGTYRDFTMVTDCRVEFSSNVILTNAVIATRNTAPQSIYSSSALQLGADDGCAIGGGATVLSLGGFYANANFAAFGGVVWTLGDIYFHARAQRIEGITMKSMGKITATSQASMKICGNTPLPDEYVEHGPRLTQ